MERNFLPLKKWGDICLAHQQRCGFRWNSYVRKQYKERIEEAKQLRKVENYEVKETKVLEPTSITLNDVIEFLRNYKDESSLMVLQQQIESLQTEKERLLERLSVYEEEYRTLLDYIDQKRSVMVAERNGARSNGELEKLKK